MKNLDHLLQYSRDKVKHSQVPPSLYQRAQRKRDAIDSLITLAVACAVLWATTIQFSTKFSAEPVAIQEVARQELVATRGER